MPLLPPRGHPPPTHTPPRAHEGAQRTPYGRSRRVPGQGCWRRCGGGGEVATRRRGSRGRRSVQLCSLTTPAHAIQGFWGPGSSLLQLAFPLALPESEARREASTDLCGVVGAAHTCAVSEGARRPGALTTLALRNVAPAGSRSLWPWRVASVSPMCFGGLLGLAGVLLALGSPLEGWGRGLAGSAALNPFLWVSALLSLEFGQPSSREAVRLAVTFASSFFVARRWAGRENVVLSSPCCGLCNRHSVLHTSLSR